MSKVLKQLPESMQRSVIKGCRKYERALIHGEVPRRVDGKVRDQFERFGAAMEQEAALLAQVRQVLCSAGVQSCRFVTYYGFARHVAKLLRMNLEHDARLLVWIAISRWVSRGCEHSVLLSICRNVLNVNPVEAADGK
ncbi:hypothetical protein FJY68_04705 [candidate division WOR-3 bacterium]|uniref:Uncharacterized protein n=1 Tax=candidate division WOR-3 bacterium TaxID=2052148 RepID=A0A938BSW2_UNCW3|nr:hypothetical protein [candidate division WOR-3 bacterium]